MDYYGNNEAFPNDQRFFKKQVNEAISGHELNSMFVKVKEIFEQQDLIFGEDCIKDYNHIETDFIALKLIDLLSEFATETRYKNLNILLGASNNNYNSPEDTFLLLIEKIKQEKLGHLSNEKHKLFELSIVEVIHSFTKITRFLSVYFVFGQMTKERLPRYLNEAYTFLQYIGSPELNLEQFKRV